MSIAPFTTDPVVCRRAPALGLTKADSEIESRETPGARLAGIENGGGTISTGARDKDGKLVAKVAARAPHDLRRSAARRFILGRMRTATQHLTGHKMASIFQRYTITDGAVRLAAVRKLVAYGAEQKRKTQIDGERKGALSTMLGRANPRPRQGFGQDQGV